MKKTALICGAALLMVAAPALRADDQPSLDQLLNVKPAPPADHAKPPADAPPQQVQVPVAPPSGESPDAIFNRAILQMRQASDKLGAKLDPGLETQRMEQTVMTLMDQVIKEAEKQQSSSSSSSGGGSGQPGQAQGQQDNGNGQNQGQGQGQKSGQSQKPGDPGPGGNGGGITPGGKIDHTQDLGPLNQNKDAWGNLPARLRDQLMQGLTERFSPIYQDLTESYYKRLAETEK